MMLPFALQVPTLQSSAQAAPAPVPTPAPAPPVRAQYSWSYEAADGNGSGTLSLLMEPASGKLVLEVHSVGERVALLTGDAASGYHLQVPRQKIDEVSASLAELPLPMLPEARTVAALKASLATGQGPGISVDSRDAQGPVKLRYKGKDEKGELVLVWLTRKRWETQ